MSSKRSRRKKRKADFNGSGQANKRVIKAPIATQKDVKLPGNWWVRTGSALLLIGGVLSATVVYFSLKSLQDMSPEEVTALTGAYGQAPWVFGVNLILTSIGGVLQFCVGYYTFRNARNPFLAKRFIILSGILIAYEVCINVFSMVNSTSGFNLMMLTYGCMIPLIIIFGAFRNMKFAQTHPDYNPPEPTQMF